MCLENNNLDEKYTHIYLTKEQIPTRPTTRAGDVITQGLYSDLWLESVQHLAGRKGKSPSTDESIRLLFTTGEGLQVPTHNGPVQASGE